MIATKLVNRSDIAKYKQISKTVFDDVLNSIIIEAQFQDVMPLLGEEFFNKIITDPYDYEELLGGGNYDVNNITYVNYGLKAVITYYVYARYAMFGDVVDTSFSMVNKLSGSESKPIEYTTKKALYTMNRDSAFNIWRSVENYLVRTNHPDFKNKCHTRRGGFNFSKIV